MTTNNKHPESAVDMTLAEVRQGGPEASPDLLARVLGDAETVQAQFEARGQRAQGLVAKPGFWRALAAAIGGWPALAGVATAGVAGLWLGINPPASVETGVVSALDLAGWTLDDPLLFSDEADALGWFGLDALEEG